MLVPSVRQESNELNDSGTQEGNDGCNFPLMYFYVACSITFAQKPSHCWESLIARSCKIGAPDSRFQRIPLRQNRAFMSSLQPASVTPLPMGKPASRNSA